MLRLHCYRKMILRGLLLKLCLLTAMPSMAAEVKGLYSADVPVHGQEDGERLEAIRQGLETVMVKVSGRREAPTLAETAAALQQPMQLVSQYRYFPLPAEWQQVVDDQGQFYSQLLRIDYDSSAVNKVLRAASLPVWGRARPSTLIWLAVEEWNQRSILGADTLPTLREGLMRQAARRGVPLMFPLLDLEDQTKLSFADIWGDFQDNILRASERYQAGVILVGRMYRQAMDEWQVRWTLYQGSDVQRWTTSAALQDKALSEGLDMAADYFAERFASLPNADGDSRIIVDIQDVHDLDGYARAMDYLETLDMARDVQVAEVATDHVRFSLTVRGALEGFKQAIQFGETLVPVTESQAPPFTAAAGADVLPAVDDQTATEPTQLSYRLLP
jgi:hypothetical protein